jgi:hypothetical protein
VRPSCPAAACRFLQIHALIPANQCMLMHMHSVTWHVKSLPELFWVVTGYKRPSTEYACSKRINHPSCNKGKTKATLPTVCAVRACWRARRIIITQRVMCCVNNTKQKQHVRMSAHMRHTCPTYHPQKKHSYARFTCHALEPIKPKPYTPPVQSS